MHCLKRVNKSVFTEHGRISFNASRINEIKRMESIERILKRNSMIALQETKIRNKSSYSQHSVLLKPLSGDGYSKRGLLTVECCLVRTPNTTNGRQWG